MAEYTGWKPALTAALSKVGETIAVEQITLTAPLAYTLPTGLPSGVVHSTVFTQDNTGGHTVTFGGNPVTVDLAAGAATLVEFWPGGRVVYPGAAGGSSLVQVGTLTLPGSPALGESVTVLADSATVIPAGVRWDSGGAPTITSGQLLLSFVWAGSDWVGTYGLPFAAYVGPDTTAPAWSATLTTGTPAATSVVVAASTLATDAVGVTGYERSLDSGSTWAAITPSGLNFTLSGLTAATSYPAPRLRAKDAAGNYSTALIAQAFTTASGGDTTNPTAGTLAGSLVTDTTFTLTVTGAADETALHATPYAFDTGSGTFGAWQAAASLAVTGKTASTAYTCRHKVRDAAGNEATGSSITVTTNAAATTLAADDFNRADSTAGLGTATTGQAWTAHAGVMGITATTAYRVSGNAFSTIDVGQADMKVSVKAAVTGSYFAGPAARVSADGTEYYLVDTGTGGAVVKIISMVGGVQSNHGPTHASASGDTLRLVCKENGTGGTILQLWVNDNKMTDVVDSRTTRPMGTRAGLKPHNNSSIRQDDFVVEAV